jgi:hypothetical protein
MFLSLKEEGKARAKPKALVISVARGCHKEVNPLAKMKTKLYALPS